MQGDKLNLISDIFFQRILKAANMISWYSNYNMCDLGGALEDDFRDLIQKEALCSDISNSNFYDSYAVEIEINMFCINAIMNLDELHNIDNEVSRLDTRGITTEVFESLDDYAKTKSAFRMLKVLVNGWIEDVLTTKSRLADLLLQNAHRWVCSQSSKLYDKSMGRVLRKIMQKFLGYLVVKLRELGATIVYASYSKLILCTNKYQKHSAKNYTDFVLRTLVSYPLFASFFVHPVRYWRCLLFKDINNFTGLPETGEPGQFDIEFKWKCAEILPPKIEEYFNSIIAEYLLTYYREISSDAKLLKKLAV